MLLLSENEIKDFAICPHCKVKNYVYLVNGKIQNCRSCNKKFELQYERTFKVKKVKETVKK